MRYSRETFETMIRDFCADHANDEDWGEQPEVDRNTISYDQEKGVWTARCYFADDPHRYTLIGDRNGAVTMFYD